MLQSLGPDLWTCPVPFSFGGINFGGRMTVIRKDGGLLLHSPVAPDEALVEEVRALGEPRWILAPNDFHHLHVGAWSKLFPQAERWASRGVPAKQPGLSFRTIDQGPSWEFPWVELAGMPAVNEVLVYHPPTRTLVATDFVFHLPGRSGLTWFFAWVNGVNQGPRQTPYFRFNIKDREAYRRSVGPLRDWQVDRISLTHNDLVEQGAQELLSATLGKP